MPQVPLPLPTSRSCLRSKPTSLCGLLTGLALVLLCGGVAPANGQVQSSKKASSARSGKSDPQAADEANKAVSSSGTIDCLADKECRQVFESARRLSDSQQYNAALTGYEKAYALRPSPWLLINIGRVQHKMGRPAEAVTTLQRFLATPDNGPKEVVEAAREYLKQAEGDLAAQREKEQRRLQPAMQGDPSASNTPPDSTSDAKPVYKKWWFWLALAGGAAAVAAVAVGVSVGTAGPSEPQRAPFHIAF